MAKATNRRKRPPVAVLTQIAESLRPLAVPVNAVRFDPKNVRLHPDRNMESVKASLVRYGQRKPVVANRTTGMIEAGNATWEAARALGWTHLAVVYVEDDPTTAAGYAIADNRTAELAEWNDQGLARILEALKTEGELPNVGFSEADLQELLRSLQPPKDETFNLAQAMAAAPELAERVKPGQVWRLGRHRLMCGDCTKPQGVEALLNGIKPNLMVTDPPYGVEYDPDWRNKAIGYAPNRRLGNVTSDDRVDWLEAWALFRGDVAYVWHGDRHASEVQVSLEVAGFEIRCQIIWSKPHYPISRGHYHWRHEPCWYAVRKGAEAHWQGGRDQTTVREIALDSVAKAEGHPTQKPLECMAFPIRNHVGDVYDPFLGTGTTMVAAEQLGRACYGMEIEPKWCAVSIARWESYSGESAVLDA